jgi:hypothetical protein
MGGLKNPGNVPIKNYMLVNLFIIKFRWTLLKLLFIDIYEGNFWFKRYFRKKESKIH